MKEIVYYFFRLGCVGFGGPLSVISQMQNDLVIHRKWITEEEFNQVFPLIKSMPGTIAFQMAIYLGYRRRGRLAGALAGILFVLPSFFLMIILAHYYQDVKSYPEIQSAFFGAQAGAFAVISMALWSLVAPYRSKNHKSLLFWSFIVGSFLINKIFSLPEPFLILFFGIFSVFLIKKKMTNLFFFSIPYGVFTPSLRIQNSFDVSSLPALSNLFMICLKAGAFVFGTGLAIVPFLEHDFVETHHWITHSQFMDALALGQLTPGPVVITVTFIGYYFSGWSGAFVATFGIFSMSSFHMLTWFPHAIQWFARQKWVDDFILGASSVIVMGIATSLMNIASSFTLSQKILAFCLFWVSFLSKGPSWVPILVGLLVFYYFQL